MEKREEESAPKKLKADDHIYELLPILPLEIIELIVKHADVFTAATLLSSAKRFADLFTEETWKLLYLLRWHGNILRKNHNNEEILANYHNLLSMSTNHSDYLEEKFYDKNNAWRNRYKHRSELDRQGRKVELQYDVPEIRYITRITEKLIAVYTMDIDDAANVKYSNLSQIKKAETDQGLKFLPFAEDSMVYQAIIIGYTGSFVKIRLEATTKPDEAASASETERNFIWISVFNEQTQLWDIVSYHHLDFNLEWDTYVTYYYPYCPNAFKDLYVNTSSDPEDYTVCYGLQLIQNATIAAGFDSAIYDHMVDCVTELE